MHLSKNTPFIHLFTLTFAMLISTLTLAQMSYEEYKESYIPHYEKLLEESSLIDKANKYTAEKLGKSLMVFVREENKEVAVAILTSCKRDLVGKALYHADASSVKEALLWLKEEWQLELMWFVDKQTYHQIAPEIPALVNYEGPKAGDFGKSVDNFRFIYGGVGYSLAWSALKGINGWIPQNNQTQSQLGELKVFKGFHFLGGLKIKDNKHLEIDFESKGVRGSSGDGADEVVTRDIRFQNKTFSMAYMTYTEQSIISYSSGIGLHYTLGNLDYRNYNNDNGWERLENFNNYGVNLRGRVFINPVKKFPLMMSVGYYWNINLRKHDFSVLDQTFGTNSSVTESFASNAGLNFTVLYKFGKEKAKKENTLLLRKKLSLQVKKL